MKLLLALTSLSLMAASPPPLPNGAMIERLAKKAMRDTGSQGLAIALINNGQVQSVQAFGKRNSKGEPLTDSTVMYGASLTKATFGYLVMQLVDEGKVDLDKPIVSLLPKPLKAYGRYDDNHVGDWADISDDPRSATITPRMALNHSTGFANFSFMEPDQKLRIHFQPGTRYSYSGDGIMLLQFALEKGLGIDIEAEMRRRFFEPLGMTRTSLKWRPDFATDLADGWQADGRVIAHDDRDNVRAAGWMDTTISDYARFAAMMARGDGLSKRAAAQRIRPDLLIDTIQEFPTLAPPAPKAKRIPGLAAGMGVITFTGPQGPGWEKGGHDDQTANSLVCINRSKRCVLILSNDVRTEAAFDPLVRSILGETGVPYRWIFHGQYGF